MDLFNSDIQINEYLIIISPPDDTKKSIKDIKDAFAVKTQSKHAKESVAHISVITVILDEKYEDKLKSALKEFCYYQSPFPVKMQGFDGFPTNTIYIGISNKIPIVDMLNNLFRFLKEKNIILRRNFKKHPFPHISIARLLTEEQYSKVITEYQEKAFEGIFIADNLTLLKRAHSEDNYKKYSWDEDKPQFMFYSISCN